MWEAFPVSDKLKICAFYTMFECEYDSKYVFFGESHNFWECVFVMDGSIRASGDEHVYDLCKNEMIFHKPMELHKFNIVNDKNARLFIFSFDVKGDMDIFKNRAFRLTDEQSRIIRSLAAFFRKKCRDINITDLPEEKKYVHMFKENKTYSQLAAVMLEQLFLSFYEDNAVSIAINTSETEIFRKAIGVMNNGIGDWLTISDIAGYCNVSCTYLKRIFFKYSSLGVHKYYIKMKINNACTMINDGLSIGETAERLGFENGNYFSTVFKRETGMTPTAYKKNI